MVAPTDLSGVFNGLAPIPLLVDGIEVRSQQKRDDDG